MPDRILIIVTIGAQQRIYFTAFISALCLNALSPIIPDLSHEFTLSRMEGLVRIGGLNNLLLYLPMGLISLGCAIWSDRFQIRISLLNGILVGVFAFLALVGNAPLFATGYLILGGLLGLVIPGLYAAARRIPEASGFQLSININIVIGIGMAVGQYASATIADYVSWRFVYALLSLLHLVGWPVIHRVDSSRTRGATQFNFSRVSGSAWLLLSQYLPGSIPWGGIGVFIFSYLELECGIRKSLAVLLVTALGIGMIAGSFLAGRAGARMANRDTRIVPMLIIVFFLSSIGVVQGLIHLSPTVPFLGLLPMYFAAGLVLSVPGTYIKGLLFEATSERDVQAVFSLENFLESLGKGFGPFAVALLIQAVADLRSGMILALYSWLLCIPPILILLFSRGGNDREETRLKA
ncbi:MAG: MFS transporter [Leptospirales bacterium]|nr:MFS transporter [Leptospirales bacterium]